MLITAVLRVASVPADHVYVRHLAPVSAAWPVIRLPDPPVPGDAPGPWWPSPVLEPAWLRSHADSFDLVHVHFGFEHLTATQLRAVTATLAALERPLVLTVHDLANPHLRDQAAQAAALDVLVPSAAEVITLTPGSAAEIARRWGRRAHVLPHPHVALLDRVAAARPARKGFLVGLHASHRPNSAAADVRAELAEAVADLGGQLHPGHDRRLTDDELWEHLARLDVLVLPYRFGTHSGFVEACHDLGTTVVATRVGHLAEQQPLLGFELAVAGSLTAAVRQAHASGPGPRAGCAARIAQREALAAAHLSLYSGALSAGALSAGARSAASVA